MIELSNVKTQISRVTIFEDKCTEDPVAAFKYKVIPAFQDRHVNKRSAEIIAVATVLLGQAGLDDGTAACLASAVTDRAKRRYRAAFAVTTDFDSDYGRKQIFADYNKITEIRQDQRLAACLVVPPPLRAWFDRVAEIAIKYIESLCDGEADV